MNWIYELAENILDVSHDWAVLIVQLSLVFGVIILLIIFKPWPEMKVRNIEEIIGEIFTPEESVQSRLYHGYIQYFDRWGSAGIYNRKGGHP